MLKELSKHLIRFKEKYTKNRANKKSKAKNSNKNLDNLNEKKRVKNEDIPKNLFYYLYLFYCSNILTNIILIFENHENPIKNNLPNLLYSSTIIFMIVISHYKAQINYFQIHKKQLKTLLIFLILFETLFFTHTRLLIDVQQKIQRLYFKIMVFYLHCIILSSFLSLLTKLYILISITGYILLNIWIFENYEIFTVIYDLLSYFAIICMYLFSVFIMKYQIKSRKNPCKSNLITKSKFSSFVNKTTQKTKENEVWLGVLKKFSHGVIILTQDHQIKFLNKKIQKLIEKISPKIVENSLEKNFLNTLKGWSFKLKKKKFIEISDKILNFKEIVQKCFEIKKEKTIYETSNSNSEARNFLLSFFPIDFNHEKCLILFISKIPKNINPSKEINNGMIENQAKINDLPNAEINDMKIQIENLHKNVIIYQKIVHLIEKHFIKFFNFCLPLLENSFSDQLSIEKVKEFIFFNLKLFENKMNSFFDIFLIQKKEFSMNLQSLKLKGFISEIYETFFPLTKKKNLDFYVTIDEKTPEFIITDFKRVKQILFTILSNTLKFTFSGSIYIILTPFQLDGHIFIKFIIKDTGIGFNRLILENLMDFFKNYNDILDDKAVY